MNGVMDRGFGCDRIAMSVLPLPLLPLPLLPSGLARCGIADGVTKV
jgi:hypothetical protein